MRKLPEEERIRRKKLREALFYEKNKADKKVYNRNYYEQVSAQRVLVDRILHPEKYLLISAKNRALERTLDFTIDIEDIEVPIFCPVLNIPLRVGIDKIHDGSPSIDRIDNNLGYIKGNIQVISNKANRMKNNASFEDIEKLYLYMKRNLNV